MPQLNDVFTAWSTKGIFHYLDTYNPPWKSTMGVDALNIAYHGGHSGMKEISPIMAMFYDDSTGKITDANLVKIMSAVWTTYGTNWTKLYATMNFVYNPIENYSMTESGTDSDTETNNGTGTGQANHQIYGFDSSSPSDADKQSSTSSASSTRLDSKTYAHTRSGNIGVTTSQQMIQAERDLWTWKFIEEVFKDIDKMLTLQIY